MPRLTPPPNLNPTIPRLKLPEGAIDSHIHLFGPVAEFEFAPNANYISQDATAEMYFDIQDKLGLSRAVLVSGGGYGQTYDHLVAILKQYPERLRGVVRLPVGATADDLHALHAVGVRGARYFSRDFQNLTPELLEVFDELGWHIQFYPTENALPDHADWLLGLNRTVVLDHFGHNMSADGVDSTANRLLYRMLETGRVWVKLSGPMRVGTELEPHPASTPIARKLVELAPERMVWGSDWPHTQMWDKQMPDDGVLVDMIADWIPDEAMRKRILVDNPVALYDF